MLFVRCSLVFVAMVVFVVASPTKSTALFTPSSSAIASTFQSMTLQSPQSLTVTANSLVLGCGVTLNWTNPQPGAVSTWSMQRFVGTNADSGVVSIAGTATSYVDTTPLTVLTTYTWKIWARSGTNWVSSSPATVQKLTVACV
jgi:hypothetical protein